MKTENTANQPESKTNYRKLFPHKNNDDRVEFVTVYHQTVNPEPKTGEELFIGYHKVAEVMVWTEKSNEGKCEMAFEATQNIDKSWTENENVCWVLNDELKSTSTDDLVQTHDGSIYKCSMCRFDFIEKYNAENNIEDYVSTLGLNFKFICRD